MALRSLSPTEIGHPRQAIQPTCQPSAGELVGRVTSGVSGVLAGVVSRVVQGLSDGVASSWRDGFGESIGSDPDFPLVSGGVAGGFDECVVVVAEESEV